MFLAKSEVGLDPVKMLRSLGETRVRSFISRSKLFQSKEFLALVRHIDAQFEKGRDSSNIGRVLDIFEKSKYLDMIVAYFRQRHRLDIQRVDGLLKVTTPKKGALMQNNRVRQDFVAFQRSLRANSEMVYGMNEFTVGIEKMSTP